MTLSIWKNTKSIRKKNLKFSDLKIPKIVRRYIKYKQEKSTTLDSKGCMTLKIKKLKNITLVTRSSKN